MWFYPYKLLVFHLNLGQENHIEARFYSQKFNTLQDQNQFREIWNTKLSFWLILKEYLIFKKIEQKYQILQWYY